ncbi:MAG TPA: OsmC family protein [Nitrospirota bacterium]|nr:OsmC family protein [Nitrospirota bacterium]
MPIRVSEAMWEGDLMKGKGKMRLGSGAFEGSYSFGSRFEQARGTNPEELIGAAHAGCFSMALSMMLGQAGYKVEQIHTTAKVHIDKVAEGFKITTIELETVGQVPGIDERTFKEKAEEAKKGCPVSMALTGVDIRLTARLKKLAAA